jgi:hypothetical protein
MAIGKQSPFKMFGGRRRRRQEQRDATADFQSQLKSYKNLNVGENTYKDYKNVYEGAQNVYADAKNVYEGMDNTFEELKVDTTGAELGGAQFAQSQADTLAALGGGVGGSGFGALTSTMGRQAAQQAAATQSNIAGQVNRNEMARATGAANIQSAERAGAAAQQQMILGGEERLQGLVLGGEAQAQEMRFAGADQAFNRNIIKEQEMLGMAAGRKTAADQARAANTQMWMGLAGNAVGLVGGFLTGGGGNAGGGSPTLGPIMPKPSLPPASLFPK